MIQGTRGVDNDFKPSDHLYYRCEQSDVLGNRLNPAAIPYVNVSVNWSKYSKPWDVVFDYPGQGIVRFVVGELPKELPKDVPKNPPKPAKGHPPVAQPHSFAPAHVPALDNYAHSEIWTFRDGQRITKLKSEVVKKEFRTIMSDRGLILHYPEV